jgi:hypothetical protein
MRGWVARVFNSARISSCPGHVDLSTIMAGLSGGFVLMQVEGPPSRCSAHGVDDSKIRFVRAASNKSSCHASSLAQDPDAVPVTRRTWTRSVARVRWPALSPACRRPPRKSKCASGSKRSPLSPGRVWLARARCTVWAAARALTQMAGATPGYKLANSGRSRARRMAKKTMSSSQMCRGNF